MGLLTIAPLRMTEHYTITQKIEQLNERSFRFRIDRGAPAHAVVQHMSDAQKPKQQATLMDLSPLKN